jgi:hypothetical protein
VRGNVSIVTEQKITLQAIDRLAAGAKMLFGAGAILGQKRPYWSMALGWVGLINSVITD